MGRIKTKLIKRIGNQLMHQHSDQFQTDFAENKLELRELATIPSKKIRNILAGYMTRLKREQQKKLGGKNGNIKRTNQRTSNSTDARTTSNRPSPTTSRNKK